MAQETPQAEQVDAQQYESLDLHAEKHRIIDERSEIIEGVPGIYMRGALYIFVVVILLALILSWIIKVPVKVQAVGVIVPEGSNVPVQAQQNGQISSVLIGVGDLVEKGQILYLMREKQRAINLVSKKRELELKEREVVVINESYATVKEFQENPDLILTRPVESFVKAHSGVQQLNQLRLTRLAFDQAKKDQVNHGQSLAKLRKQLKRQKKELADLEALAEQRVVPETQVNQQLDTVFRTEEKIREQDNRISKQVEQARLEYLQAEAALSTYLIQVEDKLKGVNVMRQRVKDEIALQSEQVEDLKVVSPIEGIVVQVPVATMGSVVGRGTVLALIVPLKAAAVIMAKVKNKDVAFIKEGLQANVKVEAYPFRQFGTVPAEVVRTFPDPGKTEFAVKLMMKKKTIKAQGREVLLVPGLVVQVDILTERRRVLSLLFQRIRK